MDIGDWITLAAVVVALGLGVASILQTQSLQKRERRERLLNEIIEWARDVRIAITGKDIEIISFKGKDLINALSLALSSVASRSQYMRQISAMFGKGLHDAVEKTSSELASCIKLLVEAKVEIPKTAIECIVRIDQLLIKLIEEAVKIKSKDIS